MNGSTTFAVLLQIHLALLGTKMRDYGSHGSWEDEKQHKEYKKKLKKQSRQRKQRHKEKRGEE